MVDAEASVLRPIENRVGSLIDLINEYPDPAKSQQEGAQPISLERVALMAPIIPPRNVICVGKNYRSHAKEFSRSGFEAGAVKGAEIDDYPAVFTKPATSIIGPSDVVALHSHVTSSVDYEAELALVIGKPGCDISRANAYEHIWGYTIVNDVTARDRQRNHKQWFMGKALDTFCPMGPWVVTADELDSANLDIKCWVNGELRQDANTRDLIFDIPTLIETISAGLTLLPGDVIATGTPAGVGIGFTPPRFLKADDEVAIEISGIGTLRNRFA
jgi:2-keto-4-pentenoate hydratase/2-oxohepta-3-ene-1,7-dioic acid hydratase in catechol pathway